MKKPHRDFGREGCPRTHRKSGNTLADQARRIRHDSYDSVVLKPSAMGMPAAIEMIILLIGLSQCGRHVFETLWLDREYDRVGRVANLFIGAAPNDVRHLC